LEVYAGVFDEEAALDKLENFASLNGPAFYGLAANTETVTLERAELVVPEGVISAEGEAVQPFQAGETLGWRLA
jgi:dihydroorotase